jgi:hypothetical protein
MKYFLLTLSAVVVLGGCVHSQPLETDMSQQEEFSKNTKCKDIGVAYFKTLEEDFEDGIRKIGDEQFTYSKSLNTCLLYFVLYPGELVNDRHVFVEEIYDSIKQVKLYSVRNGYDLSYDEENAVGEFLQIKSDLWSE